MVVRATGPRSQPLKTVGREEELLSVPPPAENSVDEHQYVRTSNIIEISVPVPETSVGASSFSWCFELGWLLVTVSNFIFVAVRMQDDFLFTKDQESEKTLDGHRFVPVYPLLHHLWVVIAGIYAVLWTWQVFLRFRRQAWSVLKSWVGWLDVLLAFSAWLELLLDVLPIILQDRKLRFVRVLYPLCILKFVRPASVLVTSKRVEHLASLQMLLKGLAAGFRTLCWAWLVLRFATVSGALLLLGLITSEMDQFGEMVSERLFGDGLWALLEIMWGAMDGVDVDTEYLLNGVFGAPVSIFLAAYKYFLGFAFLEIIAAVLVRIAMELYAKEEADAEAEKAKTQDAYRESLIELFEDINSSGTGRISFAELSELVQRPELQNRLEQLEINTRDISCLFWMLDDGDSEISLEEFEDGIWRLKGPARNFDLAKLEREVLKLSHKFDVICASTGIAVPRLSCRMSKQSLKTVSRFNSQQSDEFCQVSI